MANNSIFVSLFNFIIITFYIGIKCEFEVQTLNEIEMSGNDRTLDRGKGTVVP